MVQRFLNIVVVMVCLFWGQAVLARAIELNPMASDTLEAFQGEIGDPELYARLQKHSQRFISERQNRYLLNSFYLLPASDLKRLANELSYATFNYVNSDFIQITIVGPNDETSMSIVGDESPFNEREVAYRLPSFVLDQPHQTKLVLIQTLDTIRSNLLVTMRDENEFHQHVQSNYINYGLYFGALLILILGSLLLLLFTRELSFLWYSCYLLCAALFLLSANGLGQAFIWPSLVSTTHLSFLFTSGMIVTITLFASSFLGLSFKNRFFVGFSSVVFAAVIGISISLVFMHHGAIDDLFFIVAGGQMLAVLCIAVCSYVKHQGLALYLILGYLALFPALVLSILKFSGTIESDALANHSVEASLLIEAFIFSIGMGKKIQHLTTIERETQRQLKATRDEFLNHLISAREEEKRDLGVVLHNSVAQMLALIKGRLLRLNKDSQNPEIDELIDCASEAMNQVRDISHTAYPHVLEQFGLAHAVQQYAQTHLDQNEIDWECDIDDVELSQRQRLLLYRVLQECVNNVVRHSRASLVRIQLKKLAHSRRLKVTDDGDGFDVAHLGFGLSTIKEYSEALGGDMNVKSEPNLGTTIIVNFQ